jgi:hypothetical protein
MKNLKRNKLCYFHKLTCSHYAEIISDMNTLARDPVCPSPVALSHIIMQLFIIAVLVIGLYELLGNPTTYLIEPPGPFENFI